MGEVAIPVVTDLHIESFATGAITTADAYIINGIIDSYADNKPYVMQRPGLDTTLDPDDATPAVADNRGRGVYYWELVGALYFVNNGVVYKDTYDTAGIVTENTGTFDAGTERVWFFEIGTQLVLIDTENNKGYVIESSADTTMDVIADADFPPGAALTLCTGGAVLNSRMYVMATNGKIYGSALLDATTWTALNVLSAEKDSDLGVHLDRHHDNLVAFGTRTIEFFFDNGNPAPGSPLCSREDISYNLGLADGNTVHRENDDLYFVGVNNTGELAVWKMKNFNLEEKSVGSLSSFLTQSVQIDSRKLVATGFSTGGRSYYLLTVYTLVGGTPVVTPTETFGFNDKSNSWTLWEHAAAGVADLPVVAFTKSTGSVPGRGILSDGDIIRFLDKFTPTDDSTNIPMTLVFSHLDFDTRETKFMHKLRYVGDQATATQNLGVQWADENHATYSTVRNIDLSSSESKLTRLGKFKSRGFKLTYSGSEQVRIQGLIAEIRKGTT